MSKTAAGVLEDHGYDLHDLEGDISRDPVRTLNDFFHRTDDSEPGVDTIRDDEDHEREVRTDIIKNLERARFKPSVTGQNLHDGLDIDDYAQSTSPIRRLPDLWNHRILKGEDWNWSRSADVAETTTQQQMIADEASRVWYYAST